MLILLDQDGVLANFQEGFKAAWFKRGLPDHIGTWESHWDLYDFIPKDLHSQVEEIMCEPGLFRNLAIMDGAVEAVHALVKEGHDVHICTSPWSSNETCVPEKLQWIQEYFGTAIRKNVIWTADKTLIKGQVLLDDRPQVTGRYVPEWEHVLFHSSYNKFLTGKRRMLSWKNWPMLLETNGSRR
jgi:5'-nucleotidase